MYRKKRNLFSRQRKKNAKKILIHSSQLEELFFFKNVKVSKIIPTMLTDSAQIADTSKHVQKN